MRDFRIGLIPCCPSVEGSQTDNLALIERHLKQAMKNGADFVAFAEVTLTGYLTDP